MFGIKTNDTLVTSIVSVLGAGIIYLVATSYQMNIDVKNLKDSQKKLIKKLNTLIVHIQTSKNQLELNLTKKDFLIFLSNNGIQIDSAIAQATDINGSIEEKSPKTNPITIPSSVIARNHAKMRRYGKYVLGSKIDSPTMSYLEYKNLNNSADFYFYRKPFLGKRFRRKPFRFRRSFRKNYFSIITDDNTSILCKINK